jgi:hypothetical protein
MAEGVPDLYIDQCRINVAPFGGSVTCGLSSANAAPGQTQVRDVVTLRMSLEHMKVLAMLLKRQLKTYEEQAGNINIPRQVYNSLALSPEDW